MHVTDAAQDPLGAALRGLRWRLEIPEHFPPTAQAEADSAALAPRIPTATGDVATADSLADATDLPLFTLERPGAPDLDRAMFLTRRPAGRGFRLHYAVADVASFVTPGGALDAEAHHRVATLDLPDERIPLHPYALSERAAGLLPDQDRPAVLWQIDLDADGDLTTASVRRARVRSRARLDHPAVQRILDDGTAEEPLALLRETGLLREARERARGGISLYVPEARLTVHDGRYALTHRAPLPAERFTAQLAQLVGVAAADLMLAAGTGILRTLPTAPDGSVARLRRTARALGVDWPHHTSYAALIRGLDPHRATHAAFLQECATVLRGGDYLAFDGRPPPPSAAVHAAVALPYAHATAPLRRLVDRYTSELCLAASAGIAPPPWVRSVLPGLPATMATGARRADEAERECVALVAAALLRDRIGETFDAVVTETGNGAGAGARTGTDATARTGTDATGPDAAAGVTVHLREPAVAGHLTVPPGTPAPHPGDALRVRVAAAEPGSDPVRFTPA